jgi:L-asparagine transporter-like permease
MKKKTLITTKSSVIQSSSAKLSAPLSSAIQSSSPTRSSSIFSTAKSSPNFLFKIDRNHFKYYASLFSLFLVIFLCHYNENLIPEGYTKDDPYYRVCAFLAFIFGCLSIYSYLYDKI